MIAMSRQSAAPNAAAVQQAVADKENAAPLSTKDRRSSDELEWDCFLSGAPPQVPESRVNSKATMWRPVPKLDSLYELASESYLTGRAPYLLGMKLQFVLTSCFV